VETELVNPWSLYSREAINNVGGFSKWFGRWVGYSHEETDLFVRMSKRGYKLFYQSKSISYHKHTSKGGTRVNQIRYCWNYFGAHTIFLIKDYGMKAIYMFPLFVLYVFLNLIKYLPRLVKHA
jgi:GT2 family glycosyltransferase